MFPHWRKLDICLQTNKFMFFLSFAGVSSFRRLSIMTAVLLTPIQNAISFPYTQIQLKIITILDDDWIEIHIVGDDGKTEKETNFFAWLCVRVKQIMKLRCDVDVVV